MNAVLDRFPFLLSGKQNRFMEVAVADMTKDASKQPEALQIFLGELCQSTNISVWCWIGNVEETTYR